MRLGPLELRELSSTPPPPQLPCFLPTTQVAIKAITRKKLRTEKNHQLLNSEIAVLRQLDHPNLLRLVDHIETQRSVYLVMDLCDRGDLRKFLDDHGKAGLPECVSHHVMTVRSCWL